MSLVVYDVGGHAVRHLVDGRQSAGEKAATWDGRDDAGRPAASGVYFCKMASATFSRTEKLVLMK